MADPARNVLLLARHLDAHEGGRSIRSLLDRLGRLGVAAQVLGVTAQPGTPRDLRFFEHPGLGRRWLRALVARRLHALEGLRRPDLIHVTQAEMAPVGLAIAESWKVPYVQTADEFVAPGGRVRLSRAWCRRIVATSRELADDLVGNLGVPPDIVTVVPPGVEVAADDRLERDSSLVPVIGTAGPLAPASGLETFLNAARRALDAGIDAEFLIAGPRRDEGELRRRAQRLRIADRVTFTQGPLAGLRFWNALNVFCLTPPIPTEGRMLATALAFGVPAIASDVAGLRALVAPGLTGLRIPAEDPESLAQAILDLLSDPERARQLGHNGREAVRSQFDPDAEAERLVAVYSAALTTSVVGSSPLPPALDGIGHRRA
jgi:glycosyltransferase involved in cell wall biosynthesis